MLWLCTDINGYIFMEFINETTNIINKICDALVMRCKEKFTADILVDVLKIIRRNLIKL